MTDLRYPIGPFRFEGPAMAGHRALWIDQIEEAPARLREAIAGLDGAQLETPYRPGGWTVRQVVHHLPDSHLNAYIRFRLALTEDQPTIKTYEQERWADLEDARTAPLDVSLALLESLHGRWVVLLRALPVAALARTFRHPELGVVTLDQQLQMYAWHGRHHVAHITSLKQRMGWT